MYFTVMFKAKMWFHCSSITFLLLLAYSSGDKQPLITTPLGDIAGYYRQSYEGRTFSAFEGIPYGKPPIGSLRFAEPQNVESWTGIWNATIVHTCLQMGWQTTKIVGDEDCLYLNVYVPKDILNSDTNLDVIVHIHGGAFMMGDPNAGGPGLLMDRDIVYVTINYRVGILGFLSTEDEVVPGNNGLKDQSMALRWIHYNIKHFGGNPNSVTIIGMSAGGASVHFHYFSQQSHGLFHRGIAESGTAITPWAMQEAPLERAKQLAEYVGCNSISTKELVDCMRQRSAKQLIENLSNFYPFPNFPLAPFAPVVEKPSNSAFLTDYPYKLLDNGKVYDVPLMMSATTEEGILGLLSLKDKLGKLNEQWNEAVPYILDYNSTVKSADKPLIADKIKQFYFGKKHIADDDVHSFVKLFGDRYFLFDFERSSRMHAKLAKSPVYSYLFGYKGELSFLSAMGLDISYGVCHGEDGFYIYQVIFEGVNFAKDKLSESDEKIKNMLLDLVTSFAKNGKPKAEDVVWEPVANADNFNYLFIHQTDDVKMVSKRELTPTEFWRSLPINEYEKFVSD